MVRFTRRAVIRNGSFVPKAIGWSTELNGYIKQKYDMDLHFGIEMFNGMAMTWYFDADDLSTVESFNEKLMNDTDYWNLLENSKDFWVEGTVQDTIVRLLG